MKKILITTDLHLNKSQDDFYRWVFLNDLKKIIVKENIEELFILGDLTQDKDGHKSDLVNDLVKNLYELSRLCLVKILKGNHDYIDPDNPFFYLLNYIENITFYKNSSEYVFNDFNFLFLPHSRDIDKDWKGFNFKSYDCIFTHQTFKGAYASNGIELEGISNNIFKKCRNTKIYSGDVHIPQTLGNIKYVGTPYNVYYGDSFDSRFLILSFNGDVIKERFIYTEYPTKFNLKIKSIEELKDFENFKKGDFVKVVFLLKRSDFHEWENIKKSIKDFLSKKGMIVRGITVEVPKRKILKKSLIDSDIRSINDESLLKRFCKRESVENDLVDFGKNLL